MQPVGISPISPFGVVRSGIRGLTGKPGRYHCLLLVSSEKMEMMGNRMEWTPW